MWTQTHGAGTRARYPQLSISRVQFCSSSGYRLRSIMQAAVVVILKHRARRGERRAARGAPSRGLPGAAR